MKYAHNWRRYLPLYLGIIFLVSGLLAISSLRQNNLTMVQLRQDVYDADKNNGDIETSLRTLRSYIYDHMNTDPSSSGNGIKPPIQLKYRYERLAAAEQTKTETNNSQIYSEAQAYCETQNSIDFSGRNRVPCISEYVTNHGVHVSPVPDALYKFDFVSPTWSPDLAGWSLVLAVLSGLGAVTTLVFRSRL